MGRVPGIPGYPALRRCISVDPGIFAEEHWGRLPLLTRAADLPGTFTDLLDLAAVDELLSRRGLRTPFLRVAKDGEVVPAGRFTGSGGAGAEVADQVADDKVLQLFADGSTLVLQGLHRIWPPVVDFAGRLAVELGHPTQVNGYVTPPQSRGFSPHYDVHDVFVMQVAGAKRWVIHAPVHEHPLRDQPWTDRREAVAAHARDGAPVIDTVLEPGDVLYLPRGYLHAAEALGGVSAHLTVGIHTTTRHSLARALLALAADEPGLRESLPMGLDLADPASLRPHVEATVAALVDRLSRTDSGDVAAQLRRRTWRASRPAPVSPLAQAAAAAEVTGDSVLRWRDGVRHVVHAEDDPGSVAVELADRRLTLPGAARAALARLADGSPVLVRDLPGLEPDEQVVLARRLLREALVVPG